MTSMRRILAVLASVLLAGFALSATAADKQFLVSAKTYTSGNVSIGNTIPAGMNVWVLFDFANQTPTQFNSVFKSVRVTVPGDVTYSVAKVQTVNNGTCSTVMPAAMPTPGTGVSGLPAGTGGTFTLNNQTGVKPSGHLCVYIAVSTSSTSCTAVQWSGEANTGTNFGGGQAFLDANTQLPISNTNTVDGCTGILGCANGNNTGGGLGSLVLSQSGFEGSADWGIVRGNNWSGDLNCALVPYQFTFNGSGSSSFIVDTGAKGAQGISAEYVVLFDPIPYSGAPVGMWPAFSPKVAWGSSFAHGGATPQFGTDDYVSALACLNDDVNDPNAMPNVPTLGTLGAEYTAAAQDNAQYAGPILMCVANMGWTAVKDPAGFPPGNYLQVWIKVIDRSDGYTHQ